MSVIKFTSWDALWEYVEYITWKPMYGDDLSNAMWKEQFDAVMRNQVKAVPKTDGFEYYFETGESDVTWVGQGDYVSVSSTSSASSSAAQAVGGGGVKSAPTVTTVVTDKTTGAVNPTDPAQAVKDVGVSTKTGVGALTSALFKAFGLIPLGITIYNYTKYIEIFNEVYDAELPLDSSYNDVLRFAYYKFQLFIAGNEAFNDTITYVPQSVIEKMYDFISQHMEEDGSIEGITLDLDFIEEANLNFSRASDVSRTWELVPLSTPGYNEIQLPFLYFSENLLHNWILDSFEQIIALGIPIAQSTAELALTLTNQITEWIVANAPHEILTYKHVQFMFNMNRTGMKSTPLSLNELYFTLEFIDFDIELDSTSTDYPIAINLHVDDDSFANARCLKYGHTGENVEDYGYTIITDKTFTGDRNAYSLSISFPSNEIYIDGSSYTYSQSGSCGFDVNGIIANPMDTDESLPSELTGWYTIFYYSNIGYTGRGKNYKPDEWLSDVVENNGDDVRPSPELGVLPRYKNWLDIGKSLFKKVGQFDKEGNNTVSDNVPLRVPYGEENNKRIVEHGYNNPHDSESYTDPVSQEESQTGKINRNDPIDDINDAIEDVVDDYNESRRTPESIPDPIPQPLPVPTYPTNPPTDNDGDSGDTPTVPQIGGLTASGMVSVYNPTKQEIIDFSGWLWSKDPVNNFFDNFLKIFTNPMDAIIGLHMIYATPISSGSEHIRVGYLDSGVSSKVVTQQYFKVDCGTINIPEYYGNATDYEPYTTIHIYLPFIGIVPLKTNDVLGKQLHLEYGVDVMTGTCLAMLTTIKGDSNIMCYTFAGNCAVQIPVSGGNYAQMLVGLAGFIGGTVGAIALGSPVMAMGAAHSLMSGNVSVQHSGSLGSNAGACGTRIPYVIITRKSAYDAQNYQHYYGFPSNNHVTLGTCKGYTQVKSCHVETIGRATDNEKTEIETLLKNGIIIV